MATPGARPEPPLVVIVGPTASGKSALAMEVAERHNGEIICADSRTIYQEMDIGTAKPSREDRARVPHWGLDLVCPGGRYTAADFQQYARQAIVDIRARGRLPILVGGTGLYVDAVLLDYEFGVDADPVRRRALELLSVEELQEYCRNNNVVLPRNDRNPRHLIRAIEQKTINTKRRERPDEMTIVVGVATEMPMLTMHIRQRIEHMLSDGVVEEAIKLGKKYGWKSEAMTGNVYRYIAEMTEEGRVQLPSDAVDKIATKDRQLAKRQMTWLRRHEWIYWGNQRDVRDYIEAALGRAGVVE